MSAKLFNHFFLRVAAACISLLSSCATRQVLINPTDRIDPGKESVVLMTLKVSNKVKPQYQQTLGMTVFDGKGYKSSKPTLSAANDFNEYIVSMKVPSGSRALQVFVVGYSVPLLINAQSSIPINRSVNVEPGHVYYLGQVDAVLRKRQDSEQRAALFPLVDAAVVGYSQGTWDVTIRDNYPKDMELIKSRFPAVQGVKVDKQILPAWTRPKS